ncbi:MAG: NRDE family protein [Halieaceae bacterium]
MCLIILAHQCRPGQPLVVAANRDEFFARPTAPARFWQDHPKLLAGQDLELGGTWLGITRNGRFAAITNYRDPARTAPAPRSRGELTLDFLLGADSPQAYLEKIADRADAYAGFNLLLADTDDLWYFSNHGEQTTAGPRALPPGLYGLSNASLDTPWPKVELGKSRLHAFGNDTPDHAALLTVVNDPQLASPEALHGQGLTGEMDQALSAQFIQAGQYGTRCSTTLWVEESGAINWRETSYDESGAVVGAVTEAFTLDLQA